MLNLVVTGVSSAVSFVRNKKELDGKAIEKGLDRAAYWVSKKALKYCPIDFGPLRESIDIRKEGSGSSTSLVISFGGPLAPYALYVHEDMTKYHKPPTCAKFMTRAIEEEKAHIKTIIVSELKKRKADASPFRLITNFQRLLDGVVAE